MVDEVKTTPKKAPTLDKGVAPKEVKMPTIRDFENAIPYSKYEQQKALEFLKVCAPHLTKDDHSLLRDLLPMEKPHELLDIDLKIMMQEQMNAARSLRNQYFNIDGSLRLKVDAREAREALRGAQQIMDSILKKQEKIDLASKLMTMEQSILAVASELPKEQQTKFYERVKRILGEQNYG